MQATLCQSACLCHKPSDTQRQSHHAPLLPVRRRLPPRNVSCTAFGAATASAGSSLGDLQLMAQLAGFALAGTWVFLFLKWEQESMEREGRRECSTCGGTGRVPCICTKWNDKDVGCGACGGSGMMECASCGGGGTAVPIQAKLYVKGDSQQQQNYY